MIGRDFGDEFRFFGPPFALPGGLEDIRDCPGCGRKFLVAAGDLDPAICGHCGWRESEAGT